MGDRPEFLFVTCQVGAEGAVKNELARDWPGFRFAYSRPGFLTFGLPPDHRLRDDFDLGSVFARAYGFSVGRVTGEDTEEMARNVWQVLGDRPFGQFHVWQRDTAEPGHGGFEPSITPAATKAEEAIRRNCPPNSSLAGGGVDGRRPVRSGQLVLDCVIVEPNEWWAGYHRVKSVPSRWPGGMMPGKLPADAVSRAWLKMEEALVWSRLPIRPGARCAEIGSAPGGASQALLNRGLIVTGIDPAEMHPAVLKDANFTHIRRRVSQVRRCDFRRIRWLMVDMSVAPKYTLDAAEAIVTHGEVSIRGLLLTLKLPDWKLADSIPEYLGRIRGWGYNAICARQLQHNRQEVCVAALQKPFRRKVCRGSRRR